MFHFSPCCLRAEVAAAASTIMLTIGHSTLAIDIFLEALKENGVKLLVDVRTVPRSRHNPQFNRDELPKSLATCGIDYLWMENLGGLRHARKDSINLGWRNSSFRGYADYMQTEEFAAAMKDLVAIDRKTHAVIQCAEAVPWRCHRSLIGDALLARKRKVEDIFVAKDGKTQRRPHNLTPFAKVEGTRVWYPAEQGSLALAEP